MLSRIYRTPEFFTSAFFCLSGEYSHPKELALTPWNKGADIKNHQLKHPTHPRESCKYVSKYTNVDRRRDALNFYTFFCPSFFLSVCLSFCLWALASLSSVMYYHVCPSATRMFAVTAISPPPTVRGLARPCEQPRHAGKHFLKCIREQRKLHPSYIRR